MKNTISIEMQKCSSTHTINHWHNPLKIINITEEGRYGGPQSRIAKVAEVLKNMGVETTVICSDIDSDAFVKELKKNGVSCISFPMHRMTLQLKHLIGFVIFFIPEVLQLRKLLMKNKSDLIHCNGCWQLKGMLAVRLSKIRVPVVYHLNDTHTHPIIKTIFTFLAKRLVDAFMPACQRSKDYYLKNIALKSRPSFIIPAPVDTHKYDPNNVTANSRILNLPGIKLITVCNINYGKGLEELIDLCDSLSTIDNRQIFSFCVVGPAHKNHAAYLNELKDKVKDKQLDNFHFMGGMNNVPTALKAADIYVCVSHFEASPMAVWEAMSMELPIVSNDVGDVKNFLHKGQCGFCLPVGDIAGMADKLTVLIQNRELREDMGQKARDFAIKNLDLNICAKKHAAFYRKLTGKKERA